MRRVGGGGWRGGGVVVVVVAVVGCGAFPPLWGHDGQECSEQLCADFGVDICTFFFSSSVCMPRTEA